MLDKIIENQKQLQKTIDTNHNPDFGSKENMIQKYMQYIVSETDEVNRELNYKHWKKPVEIIWSKVKEELADIFIFWLDVVIRAGFIEEMFLIIAAKQEENMKRQRGESDEKDYRN